MVRPKVVIGIHGMGNKPYRPLLRRWWREALEEGLRIHGFPRHAFRFELVYWAHHLHPYPKDPAITDENDPLYIHDPYLPSPRKPTPPQSRLRRKALEFLEKIMDKLMLNDDLSINYKSIADSIIRKHFKDLEIYYSADCIGGKYDEYPAREVIRRDLAEVLRKFRRYDILLIAHSMGSIIAYDVLTGNVPDVGIHTLVTMGSPLGLPVIIASYASEHREIANETKTLRTPENVRHRWYNLSDLEDRIALNYNLADDYSANSRGIHPEDFVVYNDYEVNGEENHHKSYGYLRTKEMAEILDRFLRERRPPFLLRVNRWIYDFRTRISRFLRAERKRYSVKRINAGGEADGS